MDKIITLAFIALMGLCEVLQAQSVGVRVSNAKPQIGETIYLEYSYPTRTKDMPKSIWSYMATIRLVDRYSYSYIYEIQTFRGGMLKIPSFAVQSEGRQVYSPNIEIPVGNISQGK